jgi:hypothetical protein
MPVRVKWWASSSGTVALNAKVQYFRYDTAHSLGQEDVVRLHVAVNDVLLVRCLQPSQHLNHHLHQLGTLTAHLWMPASVLPRSRSMTR